MFASQETHSARLTLPPADFLIIRMTGFYVRELARMNDCPIQEFVVRNDCPCGTTIGPIVSAFIGIRAVDVGPPILSMHSIREQLACDDMDALYDLCVAFFKVSLYALVRDLDGAELCVTWQDFETVDTVDINQCSPCVTPAEEHEAA